MVQEMFASVLLCSYHFLTSSVILLSTDNVVYLSHKTKNQKNVIFVNDQKLLLLFIHFTRLLKYMIVYGIPSEILIVFY